MSLSVIVPSCRRATLLSTLNSVVAQLRPGDELLVDVNDEGDWGNRARNRMIAKATREWLLFMDDDDEYVLGALDIVRETVVLSPGRLHLFRMETADGGVLWRDPEVRDSNVSTQMIACPNVELPPWGDRYAGDLDFIEGAVATLGEPVWCEPIIARLRPIMRHEEG